MEVFCLRVSKGVAGTAFPFDRVYLVSYDDRQVIERLFRYALVLPVEDTLLTRLKAVTVNQYVNRTNDRDDDENAQAKITAKDWHDLLDGGQWLMAVPVLPKYANKNIPRYLVAERWYAERTKRQGKGRVAIDKRPSPFMTRSYLQTPQKKIRPVCAICPRVVFHQNGECHLGEDVCYDNLPLGLTDHFEESLALPEATPNVNEPEEYALLEGEELLVEKPPKPNNKAKDLLRIIHE